MYAFLDILAANSDSIQTLAAIGSFVASVVIAFMLHNFSKRQAWLQILVNRWDNTQDKNLLHLTDQGLSEEFDQIVYGNEYLHDPLRARKQHHLFLQINNVQKVWFARKMGLISQREFEENALPSLGLVVREIREIEYLLSHRGYPKDFRAEIIRLANKATPSDPPSF